MRLDYNLKMKKEQRFFKEDVCFNNMWSIATLLLNNLDYNLLEQTRVSCKQICTRAYQMRLRLIPLTH